MTIAKKEHFINAEINEKEVRLIDADGSQLGVVSGAHALERAAAKNLDLVMIAPKAAPPVCRIMDYGKFRFEQAKKNKEAKKNQKIVELKEIRLSPGIGKHDYDFLLKNAQRFLGEGNKVKASIRFRGREMAHTDLGRALLVKFAEDCEELAAVEKPPKLEGRQMLMFLSPKAK